MWHQSLVWAHIFKNGGPQQKNCSFDPEILARKSKLDWTSSISINPRGWSLIKYGKLSVEQSLPLISSLAVNALQAHIYISIPALSSFRAPTLWSIDLTVTAFHIQYTFQSLCQFFVMKNGQNIALLQVPHFCTIWKWPLTVTWQVKQ